MRIDSMSTAPKVAKTSKVVTVSKRNTPTSKKRNATATINKSLDAKAATATPVKKLIVRARAVMGERGVRSVSALQRSLVAIGVAISVPQLIRVIDGSAKHINKDVIEGIMTVLNCNLNELFATA